MQIYYFYVHAASQQMYIQLQPIVNVEPEFTWVDCYRDDVIHRLEQWQQDVYDCTQLRLNELHVKDIQNIEHPCTFDTMDDYDLLIFRKLITPTDQIISGDNALEEHERLFGLTTTPVSFITTNNILITIRERGNRALENYLTRVQTIAAKPVDEQNKPRKMAASALDLQLRLLNSMVDDYLDLRAPLSKRVEFWQQELLQGNRRFTRWQQLFQENMAFQQVENLCEEQIDVLQELRGEIIENHGHAKSKKRVGKQDIILVRINDLVSHVERIQKYTARLNNAIQSAIDLHFSAISNQTNENMRILAIITAVFAPLTLLTGVYGMNFEFIPGLKNPIGFWIMLIVMLLSTAMLILYFYRRHLMGRGERSVIDMLAQQHKNQHVNLLWFLDYEPIKQTLKEVEKMTRLK
ncbi:magnesium transporter CorA family protein [Acinetobacter sp. 1207_04]|uniref:magnesium transporter CorA family protein n=1 Tax=Acinetobacter sp. 1207_04 TaxID=2604449 RepID=UPI00303FB597